MAGFTVTYDDYKITDLFEVTSLKRSGGLGTSLEVDSRRNKRGVNQTGISSNLMTIEMEIYMYGDVIQKRRNLSKILNTNEPLKLSFSDEDDKYYLAIGELEMDDTRIEATGTITWQIPSGVAYSVEELTFTNLSSGNTPQNYITIDNPGSESIRLKMEATFNSDNGFLALQSDDGAVKLLFGDTEEADGDNYQKSEKLIDSSDFSDWEDWTSSAQADNKTVTLKLGTKTDGNGTMLGELSGTMGTEGLAQVGVKRKLLPADSNKHVGALNFYSWVLVWFETAKMGQTGTSSVNYVATDGTLIASYIIEKVDTSGNTARVCFVTGDAPKVARKEIKFTPAYWKSANPWTSRQSRGGGPWDLKKEGGKITFYWWSSQFSYVVPSLANKELGWVEYVEGQWNGHNLDRGAVGGLVTGMHLRYLSVTKLNVDAYKDDPNKFADKDVLTYWQDGRNFKAELNGINALGMRDPGSSDLIAPPGQSIIYVATSPFASIPVVKLIGRAEYV